MVDSFLGLIVFDRDVVLLVVFRSLSLADFTMPHHVVCINVLFFIRGIVTVGLDLADRVEVVLGFLVLVLDVSGEDLRCELVVNDLHGVGDDVVLLRQRSKRRQYGVVNVLEKKHAVKGIHNGGYWTVSVLRARRFSA